MPDYFLTTNCGEMSFYEMSREFPKERVCPVVVLDDGEKKTVLLFFNQKIAKDFARRNLPKEWLKGVLQADEEDLAMVKSKGWDTMKFLFPRRIRETEGQLTVEVIDLKKETTVRRA